MITEDHIIIIENNLIVWRRGMVKDSFLQMSNIRGSSHRNRDGTVLHHFKILRGKSFYPRLQSQEMLF